MNALAPTSIGELCDAVRSLPRLVAFGAGTKPRLSEHDGWARLSTRALTGIVEYEPSEFVISARAGTPLKEVAAALSQRSQHLPFDPPFASTGATVGGAVASGLNGPGRFRYGGLRDFILGVRFVDGFGRALRLGGKVVKNAAGFDVPKLMVGALGRFGVLEEVTFKVFPRRSAALTLRLPICDASGLQALFADAGRARWELDALEASPDDGVAYARIAGPEGALTSIAAEILRRWPGHILAETDSARLWSIVDGFGWAKPDAVLLKVVLTPSRIGEFMALIAATPGCRSWIGSAGHVGYLSATEAVAPELATRLHSDRWTALTLRGRLPLEPGCRDSWNIARAVKAAFDPDGRFPGF